MRLNDNNGIIQNSTTLYQCERDIMTIMVHYNPTTRPQCERDLMTIMTCKIAMSFEKDKHKLQVQHDVVQ